MSDKYVGDGPYILECLSKSSKIAGYDFGFVGSYDCLEAAKDRFLFWSSSGNSDWRVIENSSGAVLMQEIRDDSGVNIFRGVSI